MLPAWCKLHEPFQVGPASMGTTRVRITQFLPHVVFGCSVTQQQQQNRGQTHTRNVQIQKQSPGLHSHVTKSPLIYHLVYFHALPPPRKLVQQVISGSTTFQFVANDEDLQFDNRMEPKEAFDEN